jgi:hypothetical protein
LSDRVKVRRGRRGTSKAEIVLMMSRLIKSSLLGTPMAADVNKDAAFINLTLINGDDLVSKML